MISVHPEFTSLADRIARKAGGEVDAFIDPTGCRGYAAGATETLDRKLADEAASK